MRALKDFLAGSNPIFLHKNKLIFLQEAIFHSSEVDYLAVRDITIGEIEMRNDSEIHYREVKFWMDREKTLNLLKDKIKSAKKKSERILTYGKATNSFKL